MTTGEQMDEQNDQSPVRVHNIVRLLFGLVPVAMSVVVAVRSDHPPLGALLVFAAGLTVTVVGFALVERLTGRSVADRLGLLERETARIDRRREHPYLSVVYLTGLLLLNVWLLPPLGFVLLAGVASGVVVASLRDDKGIRTRTAA